MAPRIFGRHAIASSGRNVMNQQTTFKNPPLSQQQGLHFVIAEFVGASNWIDAKTSTEALLASSSAWGFVFNIHLSDFSESLSKGNTTAQVLSEVWYQ